jgi:hypothetical protein
MTEEIYALDLDEEILAHVGNPESWTELLDYDLKQEFIEDEFVANVFEWQLQHARKYKVPAQPSVLEDQFDLALLPAQTTVGDLVERLRTRYAKNQQRQKLEQIVKLQHEDPLQVAGQLMKTGRELTELLTPKGESFGSGDFDRAKMHYEIKAARGIGPSCGHDMIDEFYYGLMGVTFWIAPPKRLKSWQMIQGVVANVEQGRHVDLYCLELPAVETDMRMRCLIANVPWWHYTRNCISPVEWDRIKAASEALDAAGGYRLMKPPAGKRTIDDMYQHSRDAGTEVMFMDQLQYLENDHGESLGGQNKPGEYWKVLNRARDLSDDIPMVFAHQFNRDAMYSDSMPPIQNAKGSSAVEEVATLALGIYANKDMVKSNVMQVGTLITRNGMFRDWEMDVEMSYGCSFTIDRVIEDEDE